MLVLARKYNESIIIRDDITIRILGFSYNQVKLGISAPKDITVHREELYLKIQDQLEEENDKKLINWRLP